MHISYALDEDQTKYFKKVFNKDPIFTSTEKHPHGVLALQRKLAEQQMFLKISEERLLGSIDHNFIVDIGSSPRRLRQYHTEDELWCCMPLVLPSDAFRVKEMYDTGAKGFCTCTVLECTCIPNPSVFTSTHSIYYFSPFQIATLISRTTSGQLFAVYHQFPDMFGRFGPESTYQVSGNNIKMYVHGNDSPYTHTNPIWLNNSNGFQLDISHALVWNTFKVIGDTKLSNFMIAKLTIPKPVQTHSITTLSSDNSQPMYYIPMATSDHPMDIEFETYSLQIDQVQSFAYGFITVMFKNQQQQQVHLPRGLVEYVASKTIYKPRDEACLQDAKHFATAYCTKINMPPELFTDSILYGSVLGLLSHLDKEINVLNTAARNNFGKIAWHTQLLKFGAFQFPYWKYLYFFKPVFATIAPISALFIYNSGSPSTPLNRGFLLFTTVYTFSALTLNYLNYYRYANQTWSIRRHHGDMQSSNIDTPYQFVLDPNFKGVLSNKPLAPMRENAVVRIEAHDPNAPKHPANTPTRLILATVGFSTITPTVLEPTKEMEELAIRNRVTRVVNPPSLEAKTKLFNVLDSKAFRDLTGVTIPYNSATYNEWNRRFPGSIQQKHNEVRNLITDHTQPNKFHSISKAFIKLEKVSFGSTIDGVDDATPRLIQGQPTHQNVIFGPWMYQFGKHMKEAWNGKQNNVYFTSGQTADDIGEWFSRCVSKYKNPAYVMIDYTKYDSTINEATRAFTDEVCIKCGIKQNPPVWEALKTDAIQEGYTRHGIYYKTNDGTGSGRANTTVKNSKVNAAITLAALEQHHYYDTAVAGDDNLIIGEAEYLRNNWTKIVDYATELGFEPKARYSEHIHEVDFCSKIPYPAYDEQRNLNVIVFGPKLGKLLHKVGWNLNKAGVKSQPQTMRELMKSCRHIPFIYEFAKAVNSRLSNRNFQHTNDPSYWETHKSYAVCEDYLWNYVLTPRYGLTRESLRTFMRLLETIPESLDIPVVIQYTPIEHWCAVDDIM